MISREAVLPTSSARVAGGAFQPMELQMFGRILARLKCNELASTKREDLAQRVMANYMAGITDEDELVEVSRRPLGR